MKKYTYDKHSITIKLCLIYSISAVYGAFRRKIGGTYKYLLKSYVEGNYTLENYLIWEIEDCIICYEYLKWF